MSYAYVAIAGIVSFLVIVCLALLRHDEVRANFGSNLFNINVETHRRQKKLSPESREKC
jgi:hypothetical protein